MPDVRCHCAPGGTFAGTSPVVAVEYNAAVAAYKHMQVMAGRRLSEENCKRNNNKTNIIYPFLFPGVFVQI